jgi:hypothetical protein
MTFPLLVPFINIFFLAIETWPGRLFKSFHCIMGTIPQDIHDDVAALIHAQPDGFFSLLLATVSPQWQAAVERVTFAEVCLKSAALQRHHTASL